MANYPALNDDQWQELLERLSLHARYKLCRHCWRGLPVPKGGRPPGGVEAGDIAAEAITDVIYGSRKWNEDSQPDFFKFLCDVVDSKISHLVQSKENRVERRLKVQQSGEQEKDSDWPADKQFRPDQIALKDDLREHLRAFLTKELEGDKLACGIFSCLEAGIETPKEVAEYLEVTIKEINNAQKRFRRAVAKYVRTHELGERS